MKTRFSHIVITSLLLCNLFFTQVIVNFFHTHHAAVSSEIVVHGCDFEGVSIHGEVEKCPACSLNICHELFDQDIFLLVKFLAFKPLSFFAAFSFLENASFFRSGRAPPLVPLLS